MNVHAAMVDGGEIAIKLPGPWPVSVLRVSPCGESFIVMYYKPVKIAPKDGERIFVTTGAETWVIDRPTTVSARGGA